MRFVRFKKGELISYGLWEGDLIRLLKGSPFESYEISAKTLPLSSAKLLPPCLPSKIVAVGLNNRSHAEEMKVSPAEEPLIFLKPPSATIGPGDEIVYPKMSKRVDFEGEVGVVIKKTTRFVSVANALDVILGYTCFNDVTARDLQAKDVQFTRGKGFDTFAPMGPCIQTDLDHRKIKLETYLNGELKQSCITDDMIYSIPELICFISKVMTLLPGDVIATGTSSGVGPMQPGDRVEIVIENIGTLSNKVVKLEETDW
ncbi:MAG: fumarylacetoacetate hydrolase family protein [Candidatus Tectomicrobia bacterium]|uniref:Fumarylacetoacetate hydrolase family protein n=1 Tax=Tectimicrobiota bacterium TaxID=2528274 RepID=A0A933GNR7_UNCTE|nr:fumarylacetoacetate hydrolase family protein [Candidatus Tectomicrobia bacterium]